MTIQTDILVIGAGLAGLVAAAEAADAGRKVVIVEQEPLPFLGGQAFWSLGGLFLVDTPEQRRLKVRDSYDLALEDWLGTAAFDREEDHWPRKWAEAYVAFAAGEKRSWLRAQGLKIFPIVGWAERGGHGSVGHGNSVPRFHVTWGTGPGIVEPFERRVRAHEKAGRIAILFRHQVDRLTVANGTVTGAEGTILEACKIERGQASTRTPIGDFRIEAQAVIVASGGIGGNHDLVRQNWPARLGKAPRRMVAGVPAHVDGRMIAITEATGGRVINRDRMWHYVEGLENWNPIWPNHGIRILPGPSSLWFDARGNRLPPPLFPGFDTLGTLAHVMATGFEYSWFVLTRKVIEKEFALSGSEQNPDLTGKSWLQVLQRRGAGVPKPVQAFLDRGRDFVQATSVADLARKMNTLAGSDLIEPSRLEREIVARDRQIDHPFGKDLQVQAIRAARTYLGDKLVRTQTPHKFLDPSAGPLIAVRLNILTRKTLGGLETDLDARVLRDGGGAVPGLYAVGEAAGFGGGGVHGYRALEGTFLGGCIFSGRNAGRAAAKAVIR